MLEEFQIYEQRNQGDIFLLVTAEKNDEGDLPDIMLNVNGREVQLRSAEWTYQGSIPHDGHIRTGFNARMAQREIEEKGFSIQHTLVELQVK